MPSIDDAAVGMEEELLEEVEANDDFDEEVIEEKKTIKTTRKRKRFAESNVYVFATADEAKEAKKTEAIKYEDGTSVEGLRIFGIMSGKPTDDDEDTRETKSYVVARNASYAAEAYLAGQNLYAELAFKKKRGGGGRGKTKVLRAQLDMGKALFALIEGGNAPEALVTNFNNLYGPGGEFDHYRNADGTWKEATH